MLPAFKNMSTQRADIQFSQETRAPSPCGDMPGIRPAIDRFLAHALRSHSTRNIDVVAGTKIQLGIKDLSARFRAFTASSSLHRLPAMMTLSHFSIVYPESGKSEDVLWLKIRCAVFSGSFPAPVWISAMILGCSAHVGAPRTSGLRAIPITRTVSPNCTSASSTPWNQGGRYRKACRRLPHWIFSGSRARFPSASFTWKIIGKYADLLKLEDFQLRAFRRSAWVTGLCLREFQSEVIAGTRTHGLARVFYSSPTSQPLHSTHGPGSCCRRSPIAPSHNSMNIRSTDCHCQRTADRIQRSISDALFQSMQTHQFSALHNLSYSVLSDC